MLLTAVIAADAYIGPFGSESFPWLSGEIMGRADLIGAWVAQVSEALFSAAPFSCLERILSRLGGRQL